MNLDVKGPKWLRMSIEAGKLGYHDQRWIHRPVRGLTMATLLIAWSKQR